MRRVIFPGLMSFFLLIQSAFLLSNVTADVRLPAFFSNHMVVQQQMPIKVWGWADQNEEVEVTFGGNSIKVTANQIGEWSAELPAMSANKQPATMTVSGKNTIEIKDVLVGEVWLCTGQSNMEWRVRQCGDAEKETANANHPLIRHIKIPNRPSSKPEIDVEADWKVCSPDTAAEFTATGYYTAVNLLKELDVPIGLVNSCWGGTRIEPWTCLEGLQKVDSLSELYESTKTRTPGTEEQNGLLSKYMTETENWIAETKTKLLNNEVIDPSPEYPNELRPITGNGEATALYNGMIHPLVGLPIRGALWYQGESNRRDGMVYYAKKQALINGWREIWQQGDFPFLFVQIAPFQYGQENPEVVPEFWEAQTATLNIKNTGMVVTNDIATLNDIHPPNKQEVGRRLSLLALKNVYGRNELVAESPFLEKLEVLPGKLKVTFANTGGGLKTRNGLAPSHFQVVGEGSAGFQTAKATIDGDSINLECPEVPNPVAFRFAWNKLAEPNLVGGTGLPAGATRGGDVPGFMQLIPSSSDYQLVYDLDLAKLALEIEYGVDNRSTIAAFDRVAYLLELESKEHGNQKLFVSMNAFTDDVNKIGIPTGETGASFQQPLEGLEFFSNIDGLTSVPQGNIEFWSNNYAQENTARVKGASSAAYDFGDSIYGEADGYGSMQVHDFGEKKTVFAINHWKQGPEADIGIGTNDGQNSDWTFEENAKDYDKKRLRVFVRPKR